VDEEGQESSSGLAADLNDLPLLQDVDFNNDNNSDVWASWWTGPEPFDANIAWRDVYIVNAENERAEVYNLTAHDIRDASNYEALRSKIVATASSGRVQESDWQNPVEPLDVNPDGLIVANDVLRIINRINIEGPGELPTPTGEVVNYYDVTGDNQVTAIDALRLIQHINRYSLNGAGEPGDAGSGPQAASVDAFFAATMNDADDDERDSAMS